MKLVVQDYKQTAINAIEAGFDGIELHAATGFYLMILAVLLLFYVRTIPNGSMHKELKLQEEFISSSSNMVRSK